MSTLFGEESDDESGATFSDCRKYRWALWRIWEPNAPRCAFVGLNPSTADEKLDDPTIRRCIGFARLWGMGGLIMLNAYGFRATDPRDMKAALEPVGYENDLAIRATCQSVADSGGLIIAAWGAHCEEAREKKVLDVIDRDVYCLGLTKAGRPKHPLYLRSDTIPELFWKPRNDS